jgi:hypothetical protein
MENLIQLHMIVCHRSNKSHQEESGLFLGEVRWKGKRNFRFRNAEERIVIIGEKNFNGIRFPL